MSGQKIIYVDENGQPIDPSQLHLYDIVVPPANEQAQPAVDALQQPTIAEPQLKRQAQKRKRRFKLFRKRTKGKVGQVAARSKKKRRLKWKPFFVIAFCLLVGLFVWNARNFQVVVMGVDTSEVRTDTNGRTDSLIVVGMKPVQRQAALVSIPRDTYTTIPCEGGQQDKINHAYAYGGTACTLETVNQFLAIDTQYYLKTNFEGVLAFVEALGGLPVTVQGTFCEQDSQDNPDAICFTEGEQRVLNGEEALAYARHRKSDGDQMRQQRQQQLITATIKQLVKPQVVLTKLPAVFGAIGNMVETNVPLTKLVFAAPWFLIAPKIEAIQIAGEDTTIDGVWYFIPEEASVQAASAAVV
ncbi:MAG: LCP family protein [Culicoidibacterales bacterium]